MQNAVIARSTPSIQVPVMVVAELQDSLLVVMHDLQRLESLLAHAASNLYDRFSSANASLAVLTGPDPADAALGQARSELCAAVTDLQFQDMASQLIVHTTKMLQGCAYRLAAEAMDGDEDEAAAPFGDPSHDRQFYYRRGVAEESDPDGFGLQVPDRPNPVTQSEMDAGSIELF